MLRADRLLDTDCLITGRRDQGGILLHQTVFTDSSRLMERASVYSWRCVFAPCITWARMGCSWLMKSVH